MITIEVIDRSHCAELSRILSTDTQLGKYLNPGSSDENADGVLRQVSEYEVFEDCKRWEHRKNGFCHAVILDGTPIGTISYTPVNDAHAKVGFFISSAHWNKGVGTNMLNEFVDMLRQKGFRYVSGSIRKDNPRSKRVFEKCGAYFKEDEERWFPVIELT